MGSAVPHWHDKPRVWDALYITNTVAPGIVDSIDVDRGYKMDEKDGQGVNGATLTFQGKKLGGVRIKMKLWTPTLASIDWRVVLLPFLVLQTALLSLGVGLLMSSLTAKYRDLNHVSTLLIQLWMYATPVIMPLSSFPPKWQWAVVLNPMTAIVESFRLMLLGRGTVEPLHLAYSVTATLVICLAGLILFHKVERTFIDTV